MGKITINELHKSLFDYVQAVSDDRLETRNKTIVGAINELISNNNNDIEINNLTNEISNGKKLIANAIGEPLSSEQTFNAMSDDIQSLLATFKANMMNKGVSVSSNDKFMSLIDKIATITENDNSGLQFATGTVSLASTTSTINVSDLKFTPDIILIQYTSGNYLYTLTYNSYVHATNYYQFAHTSSGDTFYTRPVNTTYYINSTGFNLLNVIFPTNVNLTWIALGAGEEDTTLRDILASILENKGVEVTEEDDLADLINKVATLGNSENKGIQYAEGTYEDFTKYLTTSGSSVEVPCELNFTPTLIFVKFNYINNTAGTTITNAVISSKDVSRFYMNYSLSCYIDNISSNSFSMIFSYGNNSNITFTGVTWYAIGAGEFNESGTGGLDIISSTELPATGKDNQICVVTDNVTDTFLITSKIEDITTDTSKISIYIGTENTSDSSLLSITNNNITTNYYFNKVCQGNNRLASYYYQNNTWNQLTRKNIPVYQYSSFPSASILGDSPIRTSSSMAYLDGKSIFIGTTSSACRGFTFSKAIDFSGYKKVTVVAYDKYGTSTLYVVAMLKHYISIVDLGTNTPGSNYTSYRKSVTVGAESPTVYTFDISSWSGAYYFGILANGNSSWLYIDEIILE